ncbi:MAG TPA: methylhydantoinase [Rhodospirillaceae bacterium]|nr:methylhydantoinase [Rhodospirillaceae bacterium]HAA91097.1 methylhydantoinase [Rhodospirillaceae bacterium]HAT34301.1 methylhydantoinase [Rhodospirillaceae bacterium]
MAGRVRIGVDVGGTFTDFVLVDEGRDQIFTGKQLTTPEDPSAAIMEGVARLLSESETDPKDVDNLVHGTTLITNTIIERTGAKVGLISTEGHRDALEMGKEIRYDLYDLFIEAPPSLVPRHLRKTVAERVSPDGEVLLDFDEAGFRSALDSLVQDENVEALAISFMHAYRNPDHERAAKRIVADLYGDLPVTISSEVAPEIREFERTSTACANAYVQPLMQSYLERLAGKLSDAGHDGTLYVMLSGGGITTVRDAEAYPIRLIESGPAAGAMAASYYSTLTDTENLISYDMGGTTAKMCLIDGGRPDRKHDFEAGRVRRFAKGSGLPLKVSVVDMIEIGAGGGSLAAVDQMGLLKVGPRSAGSQPGPVCYGQGGAEPAVTDADLFLGYLNPDYFLGGEMALDLTEVERAIEEKVAKPLGLSVLEAAVGIHNVVNENMAAATRMHLAEKGRDPRRYDMIAFGGAGPVHACHMARLLKLDHVIVPLGAGVTSALGFLVAAPAVDYVRSYVARLEQIDWDHLNGLFDDMEAEATSLLVEAGAKKSEIAFERKADMRHVGQGFEISVPVPTGKLADAHTKDLRAGFFDSYRTLFERAVTDVPIETMSWRLSATAPVPNIALNFRGQRPADGNKLKGQREVYFAETGFAPCDVYDRYALVEGDVIDGPAVIEERESTTVMPPGTRAEVDVSLNLRIDLNA